MLCKCGCKKEAGVYPKTSTREGVVKGQEKKFVHGHNSRVRPPISEETRRKLCLLAHKGKTLSALTKSKIRKASLGRKQSKDTKRKISKALKGKLKTKEHSRKVSEAISGKNHWNWKGGITPLRKKLYFSKEYQSWRAAVFERDNYTCQKCGARSGNGKEVVLNADHIKPWALYPKLRYELSNGKTLCVGCHRDTDTFGWKLARQIRNGDTPENNSFAKHALELIDQVLKTK